MRVDFGSRASDPGIPFVPANNCMRTTICAVLFTLCVGSAAAASYSLAPLPPTLGELSPTFISSINSFGAIAGAAPSPSGGTKAYRYQDGVATDLGSLAGGIFSGGRGINDAGEVVGYSSSATNPQVAVAFLANGVVNLGTLGGQQSSAAAINNSGVIAGWADSQSLGKRAFRYSNGTMFDLGHLGGLSSEANDINNLGHIVGVSSLSSGQRRAFIDQGNGLINLGTLAGGTASDAVAINDSGVIVGTSDDALGRPRSFSFEAGIMRDLGSLGGDVTYVQDINASGMSVGISQNVLGSFLPFLESNGVMVDLNELIDPALGWYILEANAINDSGAIAGYGCTTLGTCRGLLLSPIPEPSSWLLILLGLPIVWQQLRRSREERMFGAT